MVSDAELEAFERVFRVPPAEQNNGPAHLNLAPGCRRL